MVWTTGRQGGVRVGGCTGRQQGAEAPPSSPFTIQGVMLRRGGKKTSDSWVRVLRTPYSVVEFNLQASLATPGGGRLGPTRELAVDQVPALLPGARGVSHHTLPHSAPRCPTSGRRVHYFASQGGRGEPAAAQRFGGRLALHGVVLQSTYSVAHAYLPPLKKGEVYSVLTIISQGRNAVTCNN